MKGRDKRRRVKARKAGSTAETQRRGEKQGNFTAEDAEKSLNREDAKDARGEQLPKEIRDEVLRRVENDFKIGALLHGTIVEVKK